MKKQYVFLSHDVDWGYKGPSKEHILERKDRFDKKLFETTPINKLYHNFSEFMEIEENFGVKSTFFFRTQYENSDYRDYEEVIKKITNKVKPSILKKIESLCIDCTIKNTVKEVIDTIISILILEPFDGRLLQKSSS